MIFAASIPCLAVATDIAFPPTIDKLFVLKFSCDELVIPTLEEEIEILAREEQQNAVIPAGAAVADDAASDRPTSLLDLPLELRLEIYAHLMLATSSPRVQFGRRSKGNTGALPEIWAPLLRVCRQIHDEAAPVLYAQNQWLAHQTLLSSFPRLRPGFKAVADASLYPRMRKFHVRVRLDCDPPYDRDTVTKAFSGLDELTIETFQAMYLGCGYGVLKRFEGVRGVKRVKIWGNTTGFEPYIEWLEKTMKSEVGFEPEPYVETNRVMLMFL